MGKRITEACINEGIMLKLFLDEGIFNSPIEEPFASNSIVILTIPPPSITIHNSTLPLCNMLRT